jgi:hypothetical protein
MLNIKAARTILTDLYLLNFSNVADILLREAIRRWARHISLTLNSLQVLSSLSYPRLGAKEIIVIS